jgi:hypothetical protein
LGLHLGRIGLDDQKRWALPAQHTAHEISAELEIGGRLARHIHLLGGTDGAAARLHDHHRERGAGACAVDVDDDSHRRSRHRRDLSGALIVPTRAAEGELRVGDADGRRRHPRAILRFFGGFAQCVGPRRGRVAAHLHESDPAGLLLRVRRRGDDEAERNDESENDEGTHGDGESVTGRVRAATP